MTKKGENGITRYFCYEWVLKKQSPFRDLRTLACTFHRERGRGARWRWGRLAPNLGHGACTLCQVWARRCTPGFRISAACSLLALGDSPPSPLGGGAGLGHRQDRAKCRREPRCGCEGGGGREEEEEELRSPGPGASPLTALGSDAFPESRRERNKVFWWVFSLSAFSLSRWSFLPCLPFAICSPGGPRRTSRRRWGSAFCSLSCFPRVYFLRTSCFRSPAILERGCFSRGFNLGVPSSGCRPSCTSTCGAAGAAQLRRAEAGTAEQALPGSPLRGSALGRWAARPSLTGVSRALGGLSAARLQRRAEDASAAGWARPCAWGYSGGRTASGFPFWLRVGAGALRGLRVRHRDSGRSVRRGGSPRARIVFLCRDLCDGGGGEEFIRSFLKIPCP